ncbi:hypothetical protein SCLCIDRAFT_1209815 [Scleroderma citrinum Foug A]|uniref:Uncharacterized protein n=1 Tax=Scleroderma citrinum Foug A TaxID=1036808 RepID=A0A0C3A225_9AGAM|nr:hypothetical protein SCLCIDRAFT_1209815 [Scleroderma citrinum Foug A]
MKHEKKSRPESGNLQRCDFDGGMKPIPNPPILSLCGHHGRIRRQSQSQRWLSLRSLSLAVVVVLALVVVNVGICGDRGGP